MGDPFGDAADLGSLRGQRLAQPIVGMAATRTGRGYWLVARDGGVFSYGDARFLGSTGNIRLNQPVVGMTPTPSGNGYWFVASDGGIFSYGDARFFGSTGAIRLAQPIVGMASTPTGRGYWLVARDGGIFAFGDARFHGSTGGRRLAQPIVGMTSSATGNGYWLAGGDGAVFAFGDARSFGSAAGRASAPVTSLARTATGAGYWLATANGAVHAFGDAPAYGPASAGQRVVGMAATPSGRGYWLVTEAGDVLSKVGTGSTGGAGTGTTGVYGFLAKDRNGRPVRYDPCRAQRYTINPDGAPAGAVDEIHEAFRRLGAATGISFTFAGPTSETHLPLAGRVTRASYQPQRYGIGQWAPILISWQPESAESILAGATLGYGGSSSYWLSTTDQAYVTGEVVFDRDMSVVRPGFGAGLTRGNLVLHELGHVIGLDHVDSRAEVMYPSISSQTPGDWGPGDRTGLAALGRSSGCLRVASPTGGLL